MRKAKVCPRCGTVFMHRGNLNTHLKKKTICPATYVKVSRADIIKDYETYYQMYLELPTVESLDIKYQPKKNRLSQPVKTYKLKPKISPNSKSNENIKNVLEHYLDDVDEETIQSLTDNILEVIKPSNIQNQNVQVDNSRNVTNNNFLQNSNNKQLNQHFNITVNAYGQEDLSHISHTDWLRIIKKKLDAIPELTKKIYIDEEANRNIYIKSHKDGYAYQFNGNKWIQVRMDKLLTDLLITNTDRLYEYIESEETLINPALQELTNDIIDKLSEEKSTLAKRNKKDIKDLLVDNNEIVLETSGKINNQ